jgi:hypothetical protein
MHCLRCCLLALCCCMLGNSARAYNLFGPYPWGVEGDVYYSKWGQYLNAATTPGGTISWSIMPDGTTIDPSFTDPNFSGTSSLVSIMNGLGYAQALAAIERSFDRWEAVANIYFEQVADSGAPFNGAGAYPPDTGLIRLGAFAIANFSGGAVGYAPHPNGFTSLEGDILLNTNNTFFFDDGDEGDPIDVFNDFESLVMHEIGHAIGIDHADNGVQSVMSVDFNIYQYVNRELDVDDFAAAQFLYGPALASDFNKNHLVDAGDLSAWETGYGQTSGAAKTDGDATGDGAVDGADFLRWQRELGQGALVGPQENLHAVPEPNALLLAVTAAAVFLTLRSSEPRNTRKPVQQSRSKFRWLSRLGPVVSIR